MKTSLLTLIIAGSLGLGAIGCATNRDNVTGQDGSQQMKEGAKTMGEGAKEIGRGVKTGTVNTAHELKEEGCPVVGNKATKFYYIQTDRNYDAMLKGEKILGRDERECFRNAEAAVENGYRRPR